MSKSRRNKAKICVEIPLYPPNADPVGIYRKRLLLFALALFAICGLGSFAIVQNSLWWKLQKLGHVPEGTRHASWPDGWKIWSAAESTFWWGKPLDPAEFWKGRIIWNDHSAEDAAHRRGRLYPPIPTHLINSLLNGDNLKSISHKDYAPGRWSFSIDAGPTIRFHSNYAERVYWDWFTKTQPNPPDLLEERQFAYAERMLEMRYLRSLHESNLNAISESNTRHAAHERKEAQSLGMPPESMTDDALFWSYVMKRRQQFAAENAESLRLQATGRSMGSIRLEVLLKRLAVRTNLVTEPLTPEQIKSANAWKVTYLRRLRLEQVDESYLSAYLKAWNLSAAEVFGEDQIK